MEDAFFKDFIKDVKKRFIKISGDLKDFKGHVELTGSQNELLSRIANNVGITTMYIDKFLGE